MMNPRKRTLRLATATVSLWLIASACSTPTIPTLGAQLTDAEQTPIPLDTLGQECSQTRFDRANSAFYFSVTARLDSVPSGPLAEAVLNGSPNDGSFDLSSIWELPSREEVWSGSEVENATLLISLGLAKEVARLPSGENTIVGIRPSSATERVWVQMVVVDRGNGDLAFAGDCADRLYRQPLAAYRDAIRPGDTLLQVFIDVTTDATSNADFNDWELHQGRYEEASFEDLNPQDRQIDAEETPKSILESLQPFALDLGIPEAWVGLEAGAVCTFSPQGWNECVAFESVQEGPALTLLGFSDPGDPIEVWLIDYVDRGTRDPIALLGVVNPVLTDDGAVAAAAARLEGPELLTFGDLEAAALAGELSLVSTP